jgi:hypothetical protein
MDLGRGDRQSLRQSPSLLSSCHCKRIAQSSRSTNHHDLARLCVAAARPQRSSPFWYKLLYSASPNAATVAAALRKPIAPPVPASNRTLTLNLSIGRMCTGRAACRGRRRTCTTPGVASTGSCIRRRVDDGASARDASTTPARGHCWVATSNICCESASLPPWQTAGPPRRSKSPSPTCGPIGELLSCRLDFT